MTVTAYVIETLRTMDGQTIAGKREVPPARLGAELQYEATVSGPILLAISARAIGVTR